MPEEDGQFAGAYYDQVVAATTRHLLGQCASRDNRSEELMMEIALVDAVWEGSRYEGKAGLEKARETRIRGDRHRLRSRRPISGQAPATARGRRGGRPACSLRDLRLARDRQRLQRLGAAVPRQPREGPPGFRGGTTGARNMLFVIGEYIWQNEIIPADDQWAVAVKNVREVAEYAETLGLELALEIEAALALCLPSTRSPRRFGSWTKSGIDACKANLRSQPPLGDERRARSDRSACRPDQSRAHLGLPWRGVREPPAWSWHGTSPRLPRGSRRYGLRRGSQHLELGPAPNGEDSVDWVKEGFQTTLALMQETGARAAVVRT